MTKIASHVAMAGPSARGARVCSSAEVCPKADGSETTTTKARRLNTAAALPSPRPMPEMRDSASGRPAKGSIALCITSEYV